MESDAWTEMVLLMFIVAGGLRFLYTGLQRRASRHEETT